MLLVNWKNDDHYESKILLSMQTLTKLFKVNNRNIKNGATYVQS